MGLRKNIFSGLYLALIAGGGVALGIGNNLAFNQYNTVISNYFCPTGEGDTAEANAARNMGNQLAKEIEREGIVLLKNNDLLPLSKDDVSKVCVFGHGSIDWYYMSSGSERVGMDGQTSYNLNEALEYYGVEVFDKLPAYYTKWHKAEGDSNTIMASFDSFYQVREPGWTLPSGSANEEYQEIYEEATGYSDTALFVISRHAGENSDPPHYQTKVEGQAKDETRGYLEISTEEEDMLERICEDFKNVIVVINSTNTMTLDFVERIEGIDACISVGATGVQGALAIPEILYGMDIDENLVSPSGHLTDTVSYRPEFNVTYFRSCAKHTRYYEGGSSYKTMGAGGSAFYQQSCYVEYTEGIYVGYRWFETADAEGYWDSPDFINNWDDAWKEQYKVHALGGYKSVVQYPFGFGMSYTDFSWRLVSSKVRDSESNKITNTDVIDLQVEVENVGEYPGKDVIEVFLHQPYTAGEIEKSEVKLVAYAKSPELKPGQKAIVSIEVQCSNFKSYDDYDRNNNGFKGYELEAGDYELRLQTDSHNKKEMAQNTITYVVEEDLKITQDEWNKDEGQGKVENRFTGEDAYMGIPIDGSSIGQDIEFIHRNNFPALLKDVEENKPWTDKLLERYLKDGDTVTKVTVPKACFSREMADAWDNAEYDYFGNPVKTTKPTWGSGGSLRLMEDGQLTELGQELGKDFYDPRWEEVLDQVTFSHANHYLTMDTQYKAPGIAEIGMRTNDDGAFQHAEGASQVGNGAMVSGSNKVSCVGYPASTVLAQTWNQTLAYLFGKSEGNDMGPAGKDALYSPAMNIHRSTYGGRNSGYQSEDPYLSGRQCANVIRGLGVYGKTTFLKHFCLNDQDFNRMGLYTWTTEQALREIYIRSFEEAIKYGDSTGIMTSFNRCGAIWAGGNEALLQGILRQEWGFKGQVITDMTENETNMDGSFNLRCGGNINLGGMSTHTGADYTESGSSARVQYRMREAIHEIAYSYTHALYKNWYYNNFEANDPTDAIIVSEPKYSWQWWEPALISIDAFAIGGLSIGLVGVLDKGFGLFKFIKRKEL